MSLDDATLARLRAAVARPGSSCTVDAGDLVALLDAHAAQAVEIAEHHGILERHDVALEMAKARFEAWWPPDRGPMAADAQACYDAILAALAEPPS